jgi:hypothetical protein
MREGRNLGRFCRQYFELLQKRSTVAAGSSSRRAANPTRPVATTTDCGVSSTSLWNPAAEPSEM